MISILNNKIFWSKAYTIDSKWRFMVPKSVLNFIQEDNTLVTRICNEDQCPHLNLLSIKIIEKLNSVISSLEKSSHPDNVNSQILSSSFNFHKVDSANRLLLDQNSRDFLNSNDIYLVWQWDFVNIYSKEVYTLLRYTSPNLLLPII